jgi:hypothetical protein
MMSPAIPNSPLLKLPISSTTSQQPPLDPLTPPIYPHFPHAWLLCLHHPPDLPLAAIPFTDPCIFLDTQTSLFDTFFPHPMPGLPLLTPLLSPPLFLLLQIAANLNYLFHYFHMNYVGTADHNDAASLYATVQAIKSFL